MENDLWKASINRREKVCESDLIDVKRVKR